MKEAIRELVQEKPTMFNSEVFTKLKSNCLYFLFDKNDSERCLILKQLRDKHNEVYWYLIDLFYPWHSSYSGLMYDKYIEEEKVNELFENFHIIEVENEYWDSSHIHETDKRFKEAINKVIDKIKEMRS